MTADPLPVESRRLRLRRLRLSDLPHFQAYRGDPEVGRYQGWPVMADEEAGAFLDGMQRAALFVPGEWVQIGIADGDTDLLIGDIGVHLRSGGREAEVGFTLSRRWQSRGLGREAVGAALDLILGHTGVDRIVGVTDARNVPAQRLLVALGFRATHHRASETRGQPSVEVVFERRRLQQPRAR